MMYVLKIKEGREDIGRAAFFNKEEAIRAAWSFIARALGLRASETYYEEINDNSKIIFYYKEDNKVIRKPYNIYIDIKK